jgi:hypothetical protein
MSNTSKVLYALECGHAAPGLDTRYSGELECVWHRKPSEIVGVIEYEWRSRCKNCTHRTWTGLSKHNAGLFASRHSAREPSHTVHVEYIRNPNAVRTAQRMQAAKGRNTA